MGNFTEPGCDTNAVQGPPQEYQILITRCLNGFVVGVGCKTVVFESADKMLSEIGRYYKNPAAVAQEYLKSAGC